MNPSNPRLLSVASILFWLCGVLLLVSAIAIGYPALATRGSFGPLLLLVVWGAAYLVGGYALRRRVWGVRWWGSALSVLSSVALLTVQIRLSLVGVAVNLVALTLIILSWRALARAPTATEAPAAPSGAADRAP